MGKFLWKIRFIILSLISFAGAGILFYVDYGFINKEGKSLGLTIFLLILASVLLIAGTIFLAAVLNQRKKAQIANLQLKLDKWSNVSFHVTQAGDEVIGRLPLGIIIYDDNLRIVWTNEFVKEKFGEEINEQSIGIISDELYDAVNTSKLTVMFKVNESSYDGILNNDQNAIYLFDTTERENIKTRYEQRIKAVGIIQIDNLDETLKNFDVLDKNNLRGQIFNALTEYMNLHHCLIQNLPQDRLIVILDKEELLKMMDEKFYCLDNVHDIAANNRLKVFVSMGFACFDNNPDDLGNIAEDALELAEKRGGDQATVNIDGSPIKYFGGKINLHDKNTLIDVRRYSMELKEIVEKASNVLIMCHNRADCDAIGSMLAAFRMITSTGSDAKMVFDPNLADVTVRQIYETIKSDPNLRINFISLEKAKELINPETLLLITDTQGPRLVMFPELLKLIPNVAVIDHHRPSEDGYDKNTFYYQDQDASSAVEMVTEMFTFYNPDIKMVPIEASIMLAGIVIDTVNFTQRTSSRTFEAAAKLKEFDGDMVYVKKILQEPVDSEKFMMKAIVNSETYGEKFSIVCLGEEDKIIDSTTLSKISDKQLEISGIQGSFTIGRINDDTVGISARSLGDHINVQTIMEAMGGGGHFNASACQRKNVTIKELKDELIEILRVDYVEGGSGKMEIILLEDVKGKGKKGETIEVANGYAIFLINNKKAVAATPENKAKFEAAQERERKIAESNRNMLLKFKDSIDGKSVNIKIKFGQGGKKFGSITTKLVCDEFEAQNGIHLDKKKVELPAEINSIGIFTANVKLDTDIIAHFEIQVQEQN